MGKIEEQSFRKHSTKYRSIEAKNNNGNRAYNTGDAEKSSKFYFDGL